MLTPSILTPQDTVEMGTRGVFLVDSLESTHAAQRSGPPAARPVHVSLRSCLVLLHAALVTLLHVVSRVATFMHGGTPLS